MDPFIVSARKYRPQTFEDVVGQQAITKTLLNAIDQNHLAQALLFTGPRGVGKTTCARILAKKINQDGQENPDEDFAFNIFELDAASNNSVDDIRNLIDQVRIPPQVGEYKVYIIDEVHMLSQAAFNAFLKTLEEPPKHTIFILATTEKHKIIPTILSRCQIFDFKRITLQDAKAYLATIAEREGIIAEEDALQIIAQKADGAMRDALSIFDRVVSYSGKQLTRQAVAENLNVLDYETYFEATQLILEGQIPQLLVRFNEILAKGFDGHHFITGLASHFRDLWVCKYQETIILLEVSDQTKKVYFDQSQRTSREFLEEALELVNTCDLAYKNSYNPRLLVELCLMQLASLLHTHNPTSEKKNDSPYIMPPDSIPIPAKNTELIETPVAADTKQITAAEQEHIEAEEMPSAGKVEVPLPSETSDLHAEPNNLATPDVPSKVESAVTQSNIRPNRVSGLSLNSIRKKKEHQKNQVKEIIDPENLPAEAFAPEAVLEAWKAFGKQMDAKGERILGSIFAMNHPKVEGQTMLLELPNESMKEEVLATQSALLSFIHKKVKNYQIDLKIIVNEQVAKKYAFTPQEKYEKLRSKNPALDILRAAFDLEL